MTRSAISDHSLNNLKFPIHHIGIDQSARRVRENSWQSTDDSKVAVLPQAYRPLVARNDKVELHSCEAALARPLQGIRAHRPRHATSAGVGRRKRRFFAVSDSPPHGTHVPVEEVAVGTEISLRPPHRSRRALLTHRAPTLDGDAEPLFRARGQDAWKRQVPVSDLLHSRPR